MNELLQYMSKNLRTLSDFTKNMSLLEQCDNEGKTALEYAVGYDDGNNSGNNAKY